MAAPASAQRCQPPRCRAQAVSQMTNVIAVRNGGDSMPSLLRYMAWTLTAPASDANRLARSRNARGLPSGSHQVAGNSDAINSRPEPAVIKRCGRSEIPVNGGNNQVMYTI